MNSKVACKLSLNGEVDKYCFSSLTDRVGRQELEIVIGDEHISFTTSKIGSLVRQTSIIFIRILLFCVVGKHN